MISLATDFITVRDASNQLSRVLDRAQQTPQVITRSGKPAGVLIDPATWDAAQQALALEAECLRVLAAAAALRRETGASLPGAQVLARLDAYIDAHGESIDWEAADLGAYIEEPIAPPAR